MKRSFSPLALLAALGLVASMTLAACASAPQPTAAAVQPSPTAEPTGTMEVMQPAPTQGPASKEIVMVDGLGRKVTLPGPAQKIVSLAPSNTEILYAIGAGSQVIARDDFSDYPAEVKSLPTIGGNLGNYNLEEITRLQPDLVLAAGLNTPEQVKALENLGLKVYYLDNPTDLEGMYINLQKVGMLTGRQDQTAVLAQSLRARVDAVEKALGNSTQRPKVFYELDGADPAKPWTSGSGTFIDTFIKMAGGENVAASLSSWGQISQEELIVQNPDIILLGDSAYGITPAQVAGRPGWSQIKAVKDNNIYPFDDNLVSRPSPRLIDGLEQLAKILHPEDAPAIK